MLDLLNKALSFDRVVSFSVAESELVSESWCRASFLALLLRSHRCLSELGPVEFEAQLLNVGPVFRVAGRDPRTRHLYLNQMVVPRQKTGC